jgi:hypothetical protein
MKPGIYSDLPMRAYLDEKAFSSGLAQTIISRSPLHAWTDSPWNPNREDDANDASDIGTYAHACLLEGGTDALVIVPFDDWRKKDAQAMRDDARAIGKLPILERKVPEVQAMVKAARDFIAAGELADIWDGGEAEATLIWDDDGLICKARPDWLNADRSICLSYKTTKGSAQPDAWIRTQLPNYDCGIILYGKGIRTACNVDEPEVITLVQEQQIPFACSIIGLAPAWRALAEAKLTQAMAIWKTCLSTGHFPSYSPRIAWAEPPAYLMSQQQERELADPETGNEYDPAVLFGKPEKGE